MNNKIVAFPHNDEHHLDLGRAAMHAGEFEQAAEHFEAAYTHEHTFAVSRMLTEALLHAGHFQEAQSVAEEFITGYARTLTDGILFAQVLTESHRFLGAHEWLRSLSSLVHTPEEKTRFSEAGDFLIGREKQYLDAEKEAIATQTKQYLGIAGESVLMQTKLVSDMDNLPLATFNEIAPRLLTEQYLPQALRNTVALHFVTLGDEETRGLRWFDEDITFVPAQVDNPFDNSVQAAWTKFVDEYENNEPELATMVDQELHLYLLLLFPRVTSVVTDPDEWANYVVRRLSGNEKVITEASVVKRWQDRLDHELAALNDQPL
ncbi:hypothetical protein [Schleiferilactobacillus perolens]|uniref:TPR repeat-containing protein n=1 Tax=Schleiferilactobacillus perolens DSM 12744 TaxID=1423792 RepID=A0A0R1N370_9LACO|nr:hypothetical protein [Schleiferilactobacillus perolens]KRL14169.1 hypothetical protein FD09_GL001333 [Schleiferilactobacillus perolens DSM 12744]